MPAKIVTVKAKTKEELQKQVAKKIKELSKKGLDYISHGYDSRRVKNIKGGYEIEITVHS